MASTNIEPVETDRSAVHAALSQNGFAYVESFSDMDDCQDYLTTYLGLGQTMEQPGGHHAYEVRARPDGDAQSSSRSTNELNPHVEGVNYPDLPRYVALLCVRQARSDGGTTMLSNVEERLRNLDADLRRDLTTPRDFGLPPNADERTIAPIVEFDDDGGVRHFRYSENQLLYGDTHAVLHGSASPPILAKPWLRAFCREVRKWHETSHIQIRMHDRSLLIFDNRLLHSRTRFTDRARVLIRFWIR